MLKPREETRPRFSIFTTTYLSYHKILRAYHSILQQTLTDWEWVIVDDSPTQEHFHFLKQNVSSQQNHKIRLYCRDQNSGNIGNVKNEAISLCRGKYVLEMDHDDEITPDCLQDAYTVFETDPTIGFVYMDFYNIYEDGNNFKYSDFISFGYGGYYCQHHKGQWRYVYITPNINNITASALISLPNHPRIWRRSVLHRLGNYSEYLPICDDLEILLRTLCEPDIKVAKIHKVGYIQYMNAENNNFSLIRNREINRLGPLFISPQFYKSNQTHHSFKERNAYENEIYLYQHSQLWKRPPPPHYTHKYINSIHHPDYNTQVCILGIDAFHHHHSEIAYRVSTQPHTDFILLERDCPVEELWQLLETHQFTQFKCYALANTTTQELKMYFHWMLKCCDDVIYLDIHTPSQNYPTRIPIEIIGDEEIQTPAHSHSHTHATNPPNQPDPHPQDKYTIPYNTTHSTRHEIINAHTTLNQSYLEIGVEYGTTFSNVHFQNKIGVDPSHKVDKQQKEYYCIQKMTSDAFFENMDKYMNILSNRKSHYQTPHFVPPIYKYYDVVFIDGMHQTEYVINDWNHSLKYLTPTGMIFLDDILPHTEKEQYKIPEQHYVEDGIIKYVSEWTGDVWKVVFYLLKNHKHKSHFQYKWFHHPHYRGVICFDNFQDNKEKLEIPPSALEEINVYDYLGDFSEYLSLLSK